MKLLLDTDVLLDVAMAREPFGPDSRSVLQWCHTTPNSMVLAWHTLANVYYLLRPVTTDARARTFLSGLLSFAEIAATGNEQARYAFALPMSDFEDALQVAAAGAANAQFIISRNVADYRSSPVPAITPRAFLRRFLSA